MSKYTVDKLCSMYNDSSLRKAMLKYVTDENYWKYAYFAKEKRKCTIFK